MNILLNSYHNFMKEAGVYDSKVEFFELATRCLMDKSDEIDELTKQHSIYLNNKELPTILKDIKKTYIVLAFSCFDEYLDELKKEILYYYDRDYSIKKEETKYSKLKNILCELEKSITEDTFEENCIEYYRLIRNSFVHKSTKNNVMIQALYKKIKKIEKSEIYKKYKTAPSAITEIDFEDFVLLTVILKNIVKKISLVINPSSEEVFSKIDWNTIIKRISYLSKNSRKIQAVKNILNTEYHLTNVTEKDILSKLDQQDHW